MTEPTEQPAGGCFSIDGELSLGLALQVVTRALADAGIEDAARDARFLLQGVLQLDAAAFLRAPEQRLGGQATELAAALARRLNGEPVARIIGVREFYGRQFLITPDVLDPRPDTETLIDAVLERLRKDGREGTPLTIADIGSGSGAIIVTLLAELADARGIAIDVSPEALDVTRRNAELLGVSGRLQCVAGRGLGGVAGPIDIVVSNPPYIPSADIAGLGREVRDFDPLLALDGGADGLAIYREICRDINELKISPMVFLEVGAGQADDVEAIFARGGWRSAGRFHDLGGKIRVVALEIHR